MIKLESGVLKYKESEMTFFEAVKQIESETGKDIKDLVYSKRIEEHLEQYKKVTRVRRAKTVLEQINSIGYSIDHAIKLGNESFCYINPLSEVIEHFQKLGYTFEHSKTDEYNNKCYTISGWDGID